MRWASAEVPARAALAGNPSDGHGGAVLAVCVEALRARVEVARADREDAPEEAAPLLAAAARRFAAETGAEPEAHAWRMTTTIPREVGLAGSSALVIAALRALGDLHGTLVDEERLPAVALAVEVEDLGIAAGLQDRLVQARGGCQHMEFGDPEPRAEALDPTGLPPLHVAWLTVASGSSGAVHAALNADAAARAAEVGPRMARLAALARTGRDAIRAGDHAVLGRAGLGSFRLRQELMAVDPRHAALVEAFVAAGGWANSTGSGGAVVGWAPDGPPRAALAALGADVVAV